MASIRAKAIGYEPVRDHSLPDGNCAFNALSLGLCDKVLLNQLEQDLKKRKLDPNVVFAPFIQIVAVNLMIAADWQKIKEFLIELRNEDKRILQVTLAPLLRKLAMARLADPTTAVGKQHKETTLHLLQSEFREFVAQFLKIPLNESGFVGGDVFSSQRFVVQQFEKIFNEQIRPEINKHMNCDEYLALIETEDHFDLVHEQLENLNKFKVLLKEMVEKLVDKLLDDLKKWWDEAGHKEFLKSMSLAASSSSEIEKYAGDMELQAIAELLDIPLVAEKNGMIVTINLGYGQIPISSPELKLDAGQIKQLIDRGIVDRGEQKAESLKLLDLDIADVTRLLNRVGKNEQMKKLFLRPGLKVNSLIFSNELPEKDISKLVERGILAKRQWGTYILLTDPKDAMERVSDVPDAKKILTLWKNSHREVSSVILKNSGAHWDSIKWMPIRRRSFCEKVGSFVSEYREEIGLTAVTLLALKGSYGFFSQTRSDSYSDPYPRTHQDFIDEYRKLYSRRY